VMPTREYSQEEIQKIWNKVRPREEEGTYTEIRELRAATDFTLLELGNVRDLVLNLLERIKALEETEIGEETNLLTMPREEAERKIKEYIDEHPGCRTGDIIYDLRLDPDLVLAILHDFEKKGKIRGKEIEYGT